MAIQAMEVVERGTTRWLDAWNTLKVEGKDIDSYMLMYAIGDKVYFKHCDTREYHIVTCK